MYKGTEKWIKIDSRWFRIIADSNTNWIYWDWTKGMGSTIDKNDKGIVQIIQSHWNESLL